jgi:hypothetical protein
LITFISKSQKISTSFNIKNSNFKLKPLLFIQ